MTSPLIGLSGRRKPAVMMGAPWGFADAPLDVYMSEYATSVLSAGGLPMHLPLDAPAEALVERLDGLLLAGGDDIDPRRYGQIPGPFTPAVDPERDRFEAALVEAAVEREIPVLGICRGAQLINVVFGGTLIQHLASGEGESHGSYAYPRAHRSHTIDTAAGSLCANLYGQRTSVNSFHHQAADEIGTSLAVTARAADGIVEAVEHERLPIVGVQWHPETFGGDPIFGWLVEAASKSAANCGKAA